MIQNPMTLLLVWMMLNLFPKCLMVPNWTIVCLSSLLLFEKTLGIQQRWYYSTVWAATGLCRIKQSSTGASMELVCCQKVEDWATELNSLFSDKPSMSLVEASGTRWLIWLEIFWGCVELVGFWWRFFYGFGSHGMRNHHGFTTIFIKSWWA